MSQPPAWKGYRAFIVTSKVAESETVVSFYLHPEDGGALPTFRPGQSIGIKLEVPDQVAPIMRSYTLSNSPANDSHYRLSIKREPAPFDKPDVPPGASSNFMHDHVYKGSMVQLRAPGGDFVLRPEGKGPVVLLAGGIGCTPLISMLGAMADAGPARDVWFIHGVRNGREHAFGEYVRKLSDAHHNIRSHIRYSRPDESDQAGQDFDSTGHVDMKLLKDFLPGSTPQFFLCGGTSFMRSLYQGLTKWGVDPFQINYEFFGPASELTNESSTAKRAEADSSETFEVTFKRCGVSATWSPAAGSILELAEANNINPDFICREGMCQTCLSQVIEGSFDYLNDGVVPPDDDNSILICSSRPTSDLVLDM